MIRRIIRTLRSRLSRWPPRSVRHGPRESGRVALTFDDGPGPGSARIAEILSSHGARATFFVVGRRIPEREGVLRHLVDRGHELGNHTFSHRSIRGKPLLTIYQIVRAGHRVRAAVGAAPRVFRPPHGVVDGWIALGAWLVRKPVVTWSVDPRDWEQELTPAELCERVTEGLADGDIVLLHDRSSGTGPTIEALPSILRTLAARGVRAVTVSELLAADGARPSGYFQWRSGRTEASASPTHTPE
jgi:peptidoglycan/xylan/chitin deacetylase (PgdA/CDA1 family)